MIRAFISLLILTAFSTPCFAATAVQVEFMANGVHDRDGNLLSGGKVWTYSGGTNLPKATYLDRAAATPASNPIVLDGEGKANIYAAGLYKFVVQDADGATIRIMDNFSYQDSSAALTSALTVSTTTDPQLAITNGAYSTTLGVNSVGETVLKPSSAFAIENATPQFILDNTSKQAVLGVDSVTGGLSVSPEIRVVNGAFNVGLQASTGSSMIFDAAGGLGMYNPAKTAAIQLYWGGSNFTIYGASVEHWSGLFTLDQLRVKTTSTFVGNATFSDIDPPIGRVEDIMTLNSDTSEWVFGGLSSSTGYCSVIGDPTRGGFVVLASFFATVGASPDVAIGTITDARFIPANLLSFPLLAQRSGSVYAVIMSIGSDGSISVAPLDGTTPLATGDVIYFSNILYPLK